MRRFERKEFLGLAGLLIGLLCFPVLHIAGNMFAREGLITLWIRQSLGIVTLTSPPAPEPEPEPDHTRPLAIMIDNHPDARPQSGIAKADVVWEAPVEGGLTRDLAIFRSASATEIGPVRSARPYFLRWAREYDALYAHVGGSDEALAELASGALGLDDVNEFSNGSTFWRDSRRSAPHNTYTSSQRLKALIDKKQWSPTTEAVDATSREREAATGTPATIVTAVATTGGDAIEFRWDDEASGYALWRRGRQMRDRDGTPIMPRTVVVLPMGMVDISDPHAKGLIGLQTIGTGDAVVFRNGVAQTGFWEKKSPAEPTRVMDANRQRIPFSEGQIWYVVIGANGGGSLNFN